MIIAGTGHRPDKLGGYDWHIYRKLVGLAVQSLQERNATKLITGMALGWDMALADAAVILNLPFIAAIPFEDQASRWRLMQRVHWQRLVKKAAQAVIVSEGGYAPWKMQRRNEWMVDHCDRVLALFNGTEGGTANCIKYAGRYNKPVDNVWSEWVEVTKFLDFQALSIRGMARNAEERCTCRKSNADCPVHSDPS